MKAALQIVLGIALLCGLFVVSEGYGAFYPWNMLVILVVGIIGVIAMSRRIARLDRELAMTRRGGSESRSR